jgi:hypothetical protein
MEDETMPEKYPFKRVGAADPPEPDQAASLLRSEARSGRPQKPPRVPQAFLKRERAATIDDPVVADARTRKLLYAHVERDDSGSAVLASALKRALRAPSTRNLERMRAVANEVGRRRGGGKALREALTEEAVEELIRRSAK